MAKQKAKVMMAACPYCERKQPICRVNRAPLATPPTTCKWCKRSVRIVRTGGRIEFVETHYRGPEADAEVLENVKASMDPAPGLPIPANDIQVGGTHYRRGSQQHWDRMWEMFGPAWFVGNITKYSERYRLKNGLEDLAKVVHYAAKLEELETAYAAGTGVPPGTTGMAPGSAWPPLPSRK